MTTARQGTAVIVFAKAPVPGSAKTRLAPALGAAGAAALAGRLLVHAVNAAAAAPARTLELCITPDGAAHPALGELQAAHPALHITSQGEGDLGQRMARALERALQAHEHALLMGTDAPALDAACLAQADAALAAGADAAFVPALDGGYALAGLRRPAPALFEGIAWSTGEVMQHTRARAAAAGLRIVELPPVADIDEPADLQHVPAHWLRELGLAWPAGRR